MHRTSVGGKAANLAVLSSVPGISVPLFTVLPAHLSGEDCRLAIEAFLAEHLELGTVAVRSSALNEDSSAASFAGMYSTKLGVPVSDIDAIVDAVEAVRFGTVEKQDVARHYAKMRGFEDTGSGIAVIVQEMINADFSGVAFSHSLHAKDGYYLISVTSGLGEAVASGAVNGRLVRVARGADLSLIREAWLSDLMKAMRAIEWHMGSDSLDVEFAFKDGLLHILQCRPLATRPEIIVDASRESDLAQQIESANVLVREQFNGDILGDMIDINPLELLGTSPTALDVSIFGHLFADTVVERVRRDMGYAPLDTGLIRVVSGKPYVSLRASAYSFRPRGVCDAVYERMFDTYRKKVADDPGLQSRVEFSVFAMREGDKLEHVMESARLSESERGAVRTAFRKLDETLVAMSGEYRALLAPWLIRYGSESAADSNDLQQLLDLVVAGTEWFVRIARLAFYWKNKFEELHPEEDLNELLRGHIESVSSKLQADMHACFEGAFGRDELVRRYGHLRPGQFSVFGLSYASDPEHFLFSRLKEAVPRNVGKSVHAFADTEEFKNVVVFMQAREETKFLFSRRFGEFVDALKAALKRADVPRVEASACTWIELRHCLDSWCAPLAKSTDALPMLLPEVIVPETVDLSVVASSAAAPSYITRAVVTAPVCVLESPDSFGDLRGAIALIPHADPGYDYLFNSGVVGIIARNGGPASHMCIRAVELQMPSCIGCGAAVYDALRSVHAATLDCYTGQIILPE